MALGQCLHCQECEQSVATVRCCDCPANLCQECYVKIHAHRILKSHVVDVLHPAGQCPICDHNRWCENAPCEPFPTDCRACLDRIDALKRNLRSSFESSKQKLDSTYDELRRDLVAAYDDRVQQLTQLYNTSLRNIEQTSEKVSTIFSHSTPKLCGCKTLHEEIVSDVAAVNLSLEALREIELFVIVSPSSIVNWFEEKIKIGSKQSQLEPIVCCRIVSGVKPVNDDPLYNLLRSDGKAGLQLHSLHLDSNLRVGDVCEVVEHFGLDALIIRSLDDAKDAAAGRQTFALKCRPDASLVVLDVDPRDCLLSIASVELVAYDIKLGRLMLVKRDHLIKKETGELVSAVPGCIFEPLLDLPSPIEWPELNLFAGTKFCLNGMHKTTSDRCVFTLTFYEPERQRDLSLVDFLALKKEDRPRIECLQWIESQPAFSNDISDSDVLVVSVRSINTIFVQTDSEGFSNVETAIMSCKDPDVLRHPRVGARCLSTFDSVYCRTVLVGVVEMEDDEAKAQYILYYPDYGNLEIVPKEQSCLKRPPPILNSFPCTLKRLSIVEKKHNYTINELRTVFENRMVNLNSFKPKLLGIQARLTWVDIAQMRVYAQQRNTNVLRSINQRMDEPGQPVTANDLSGLVQIYSKNRECFCRGLVETSEGKSMSVRLIDYGDLLSGILASALRKCPEELSELPAQARRCALGTASSVELFGMLNKVNEDCVVYCCSENNLWPIVPPASLYDQPLEDDPIVKFDWTNEPLI